MDSVGRAIAIVAAVILVLIVPLNEIAKGQSEAMQGRADTLTEEFTDTARQQGYITTELYENYLTSLGKLGDTYNISIQAAHPVSGKEIAEGEGRKEVSDLTAEYTPFNSVKKDYKIKQLSTGHIHTDDCYSGHRHAASSSFIHYHQHVQYNCIPVKTYEEGWVRCTRCNGEYMGFINFGVVGVSSIITGTFRVPERTDPYNSYSDTSICPYCGKYDSMPYLPTTYRNTTYSYTCGYDRDMDGDGRTDNTVGSTQTYAYTKDYPQTAGDTGGCLPMGKTSSLELITHNSVLHFGGSNYSVSNYIDIRCADCKSIVYSYSTSGGYNNYSQFTNYYKKNDGNGNIITVSYGGYSFDYGRESLAAMKARYIEMYTQNGFTGFSKGETYKRQSTENEFYAYGRSLIYTYTKNYFPVYDSNGNYMQVPNTGCPFCAGTHYSCGQIQDDTLDCGAVVMSLTATSPNQTVFKGDSILTTATAVMMDESIKTVNCTASGYDSNSLGTQQVTLTYNGLVNNAKTYGTKTCTTTVTVKSRKTLTDIIVTPDSQEIQRYTDPTFSVTATYSDGTGNPILGASISGFDNTVLGRQIVTLSYTEEGVQRSAAVIVTVKRLTSTCPVCGTVYELDDNDMDQGCPSCSGTMVRISAAPEEVEVSKGDVLPVTVTATYRDGRIGILSEWTSNYNPNQLGLQDVTITYNTFSTHVMVTVGTHKTCPLCGNKYSLNPDGNDPGCPICASEVVSICASPKIITIEQKGELPITVTATYKDGHTNIITGWGTNFTADQSGEYDVPIYYKTAVDSVHVTVLEEGLITCPYCHTRYSYSANPSGCPNCSKQIVGIEAQLRYGGNQVSYRSDLSLQVVLIYRDTHRKLTYTGFEYSGFDSSLLGIQTVTVTYGEFSTTITVEVIDNPFLVTCPICGSGYYLNEDRSDPGCPYCNRSTAENAVFYFNCTYTTEILNTLYTNGTYYLIEGDYLTVTIIKSRDSVISRLANLFRTRRKEDFKKENSSFGGEVRIL